MAIIVPRNVISRIESLGGLSSDTFKISKMVIKTKYILLSILFNGILNLNPKLRNIQVKKNSFRNNKNHSLNLI